MENSTLSTLKQHQEVLYELLQIVDNICKKHKIRYMLFAGSALGAARHQGFIPWDDDLDIVMLRTDYERFLEIAPKELDENIYFLQKEYSEHWPMFFSKLRKNNTTCIERYVPKDNKTHQGIYVDIFPCDNLSDSKLICKLQFFASKIVIAKSLEKRGYLTNSRVKKIFMLACRFIPKKSLHKFVQMKNNQNTKYVHTFFGASSQYKRSIYPREWFSEVEEHPFEQNVFPISLYNHELLIKLYDDYMTPLSEEKRNCKKHAEIVDVNHSYENYIEIQKNMKFNEYTRSIR